jgi:hypothetical protein
LQRGFQFAGCDDGAPRMIFVPNGHVEKCHHRVADVFIDEGAVFHQHLGGHAQVGIDHFVGFLGAEILGQLGKR